MISVVCVYNDENVLDGFLLKGLREQTARFELIKIDNTAGAAASAAQGLNMGGRRAQGEYIAFAHQDVYLMSADWLSRAESLLREIPDLGAAGVAGMRKTRVRGLLPVGTTPPESRRWSVFQGPDRRPRGRTEGFDAPVEVQTLDEQLLIVPRKVFARVQFDEETCAGWHLYGVDYSLSVRKTGLKAYALPLPAWHLSGGNRGRDYYAALVKVLRKHREETVIYTTCGLWCTSRLRNLVNLILLAIRSEAGRWLGRNDHGAGPAIRHLKMLIEAYR